MHPFLRRAHPIGGMAEPASSAHDAGSQFARGHMLARSCGGHTRMVRMRNLEVPLAPPEASLPEGKCSRTPAESAPEW